MCLSSAGQSLGKSPVFYPRLQRYGVIFLGVLALLLGLLWCQPVEALDRVPLTLPLLEERLSHPEVNEGALTINLQNLVIDLTPENSEFREQFYQQVQAQLSHSSKPLGLDLSHSLIQGEFQLSKLGLYVPLSMATLPQNLSPLEQEQIRRDPAFVIAGNEIVKTVTVFRGLFKFADALFTGQTDFAKTLFLQRVAGNHSKFFQETNWSEARFYREVDLSEAIFGRDFKGSKTHFWGHSKFQRVQFQGQVDFSLASFWETSYFTEAEFAQLANFTQVQWLKTVNFSQGHWRDRLLFSESRFFEDLNLSNATLEKTVALRYSRLSHRVNLQDVKLLAQLDFSNAVFFPFTQINVSGLAFDSDQAKLLGDKGLIGKVLTVNTLEGNETVLRNLVRNFRDFEQIADANQVEYTRQQLRLQQLNRDLAHWPKDWRSLLTRLMEFMQWVILGSLLLFSHYGTNVNLVLGIGLISIAWFGFCFWLIDRVRRWRPTPILPSRWETLSFITSFGTLSLLGLTNIFAATPYPGLSLLALTGLLFPLPLALIFTLYQQGRYHDLLMTSYLTIDGSMRQLRLLIVRLPVIPEFPFFRDRYTYLVWERHWNWLNYYDFSCNNWLKLGFNDIRLRDEHLPGLIAFLAWYQWGLGILYISLFLWTLSRTIPGLNLLIYLR